VSKKAKDSECFDEFPARRFELAAKLQTEKLPGHLQNAEYLFVAGFQFREEFLLLQLKMRSSHWRPRSRLFISKRPKSEDAAQRLQRFVHWEVPFEETFHRRFAVVALNVHGLRPYRIVSYRFSPSW
jgi:hypothetical protein